MKLTLLAPLLLSSTAFAGVGRWSRRQDAIVICRPGVAGDCAAGQRCQYATRNPVQIGYDGACVADTSSSSSSSVAPASSISTAPAPGPSVVICRDDADCTSAERCQFVTRNPERPGYDGACVARGTGSSSSAGPAPSNGACTVNTDCPATQFCDSSASTGPSTCVNYRDCRMNGCPGGTCVAQNSGPTVDPRNPNEPFQCNFTIPASSSAPVSSASASVSASVSGSISSASNSASATSSAPSGVPSVVICANDNECSKTQFCKYVTRNPDGSGKNGACTEFSDCRGRIGCGSDKGAQICAPPANNPTVYYKDPTVNFTCVASLPSSSVQPSSSSGPTGSSVHPTSQVGPTESAHPPPPPPASSKAAENSPAPPAPPASSKAAEHPPAPPAPAPPAPPASSSAAPAPAPPAPPAPSKSAAPPAPPAGKCKADYAEILKLLYEIKGEVECVKKDVEDLKSKLNA